MLLLFLQAQGGGDSCVLCAGASRSTAGHVRLILSSGKERCHFWRLAVSDAGQVQAAWDQQVAWSGVGGFKALGKTVVVLPSKKTAKCSSY